MTAPYPHQKMSAKYLGKLQVKKPGFTHTLSDYAEHRQCDRALVSRWLKAGRLTEKSAYKTFHDGIWHINPAFADLELEGKAVPDIGVEQQVEPISVSAVLYDGEDGAEDADEEYSYPALGESKAKKEFYLAKQERLKSQTLEKTLVLASDAEKVLFDLGREIRENLTNLPLRITDAILSIPTKDRDRRFKILTLLEREINECLISLGDRASGEDAS